VCDTSSVPAEFGLPFRTNWAGQEYVLYDSGSIEWPASPRRRQAGWELRAPYADELIVAYETQAGKDASLELSYVHKRSMTCSRHLQRERVGVVRPLPEPDDPETWTEQQTAVVDAVNMPGLSRTTRPGS